MPDGHNGNCMFTAITVIASCLAKIYVTICGAYQPPGDHQREVRVGEKIVALRTEGPSIKG